MSRIVCCFLVIALLFPAVLKSQPPEKKYMYLWRSSVIEPPVSLNKEKLIKMSIFFEDKGDVCINAFLLNLKNDNIKFDDSSLIGIVVCGKIKYFIDKNGVVCDGDRTYVIDFDVLKNVWECVLLSNGFDFKKHK